MDDESMLFVANDIDRFSIGSTTDGLTPDADGSLTIYSQHSRPEGDCAANWLPTPSGSFNLTMRFYTPVLDKSHRLPPVQKVE